MEESILNDKVYDLGVSLDTLCENVYGSHRVFELNVVMLNHTVQRNLALDIPSSDPNIDFDLIIANYKKVLQGYISRCSVMLLNTTKYMKIVELSNSHSALDENRFVPGLLCNAEALQESRPQSFYTEKVRYQDLLNRYKERLDRIYYELIQKIRFLSLLNFTELIQNAPKQKHDYSEKETVDCPICFSEKVDGIKPECCGSKQSICLSCLYTTLSEQYKKIKNIEPKNITIDELLGVRYSCCFCRKVSCYKKFSRLFETKIKNTHSA
jgi:hypothetical protein